jgi:glycosyltransferase involved in cell wall biosynthesis
MEKNAAYTGKNFWDAAVTVSTAAESYYDTKTTWSPYDNNPLALTILISCYNEEEYIEKTLAAVVEAMRIVNKTYEIIVIDDSSKDRSVEFVQRFIRQHPDINIILRVNKKNKGLAQNYIDGAFIGRGKYYRLICGDFAEPIETITTVLQMMGEADMIIPYYVSAKGKPASRQLVSKIYTWIINLISGNKINYYNGQQVHLRYNVMRWHPNTRGFGFQAALVCLLLDMGFTYKQIPCITIERREGGGSTAISWKNLRSVMHAMVSISLRRIAPWTTSKDKKLKEF